MLYWRERPPFAIAEVAIVDDVDASDSIAVQYVLPRRAGVHSALWNAPQPMRGLGIVLRLQMPECRMPASNRHPVPKGPIKASAGVGQHLCVHALRAAANGHACVRAIRFPIRRGKISGQLAARGSGRSGDLPEAKPVL